MPDLDWQHVAGSLCQPLIEDADNAFAFGGIFKRIVIDGNTERKFLLDQNEMRRILVSRDATVAWKAKLAAEFVHEGLRVVDRGRTGWPFGRDVYRSEVLALLDGVGGVDAVTSLELAAAGAELSCGNVCVGATELVVSGTHAVEVAA